MAYLVLDLDFTSIIGKTKEGWPAIHSSHTLTSIPTQATLCNGAVGTELRFINQEELSDIINTACTEHEGLIILTSGLWDAVIRDIFADYLDLSPQASDMVRQCRFHSPITDQPFFNLPLIDIQYIEKSERLEKIISHDPLLKGKRFVALDDDKNHIASLKPMTTRVKPIFATPYIADKSYYKKTSEALTQLAIKEKKILHPFNKLPRNINVRFFDSSAKRKREYEKENKPSKRMKVYF